MAGNFALQGGVMLVNTLTRTKRVLLLMIVGIVMASLGCFADTRGPISILGDSDFTTENGVVAGSGAVDDPYVIVGWEIVLGEGDAYGVQIENVTKAFVLRGLVIYNALSQDGAAIQIGFSEGGRLEGCAVSGALVGIKIVSSTDIEMVDCVIDSFGLGLRVEGETADEYRHTIDSTNLFNGRSIVYVYGADGATIEGEETSHITVAGSRNVTIAGNEVTDGDGITLAFVTDSTITSNASYRTNPVLTEHGIHLYQSDGNVVRDNTLGNNRLAGLQLTLSTDNEIEGNQFLANDTGLRLLASDGNEILNNIVFSNTTGMLLTGGSSDNRVIGNVVSHENTKQGISLDLAMRNLVERNGLANCEVGILLAKGAVENQIVANTIVSGAYGISLYGSFNEIERNLVSQQSRGIVFPETLGDSTTRGNTLRGNVFADNGSHLYTNLDSSGNTFTENAFLGNRDGMVLDRGTGNVWSLDGKGNYWGGTDIIDEDGDGIGDAPVTVYTAAVDDAAPLASIEPSEAGVGILSTLPTQTITVERGDGTSVEVEALRAIAGFERWAGFRGFPEEFLGAFPGILFDFEDEGERKFTMLTVLFDLDIAFFDGEGLLVGRTTMLANSEDLYTAEQPFRYAIELPAGSLDELSIGADAWLVMP